MNTSCTLPANITAELRCTLVKEFRDVCEGGGYVSYTTLVSCQDGADWSLVLAGCILWLLFLFLFVAVTADAFFSPNIAGIVSHLKISENIAGVTFMAFGNGANDIFSSIASVLSTGPPKPGLAIGGLVGAGIFVTTVVVGSVVMVKPFEVMRRPLMRDLGFYLLAVAWTIFVFLHNELHLWETIGFIAIYAAFALVVIFGRVIRQQSVKKKFKRDATSAPPRSYQGREANSANKFLITKRRSAHCEATTTKQSFSVSTIAGELNENSHKINGTNHEPTSDETEWNYEPIFFRYGQFSSTSADGLVTQKSVSGVNVITTKLPRRTQKSSVFNDLLRAASPISEDEWKGNLAERIFAIVKVPIMVILKLTNPQSGNNWSKVLAIIHCFTCPLFAVIAIHEVTWSPSDHWPQLWALALIAGLIPAVLVLVFTNFHQEPRFFQPFSTFLGFIMAVFWIYTMAHEIVGVLQMIGVVSGLSHEILGLTLLAWSNSLGDLISDTTVARRGFPKMGISAAFGAPLFNLLLGFGLPFTIAKMRSDRPLTIELSNMSKVLLGFLAASLISSFLMLPAQRFYVRRPYGIYLIALYVSFIVVVVLTELGVLFGGSTGS